MNHLQATHPGFRLELRGYLIRYRYLQPLVVAAVVLDELKTALDLLQTGVDPSSGGRRRGATTTDLSVPPHRCRGWFPLSDQGRPGAPRRIAHLDKDAFYASVELLEHPELKGLPVVVDGRHPVAALSGRPYPRLKDDADRGVATMATYEAHAFGVHSGFRGRLGPWILRTSLGLRSVPTLCPEKR